jgi:pimeloyl-ACP methyl ester carboxylesterase
MQKILGDSMRTYLFFAVLFISSQMTWAGGTVGNDLSPQIHAAITDFKKSYATKPTSEALQTLVNYSLLQKQDQVTSEQMFAEVGHLSPWGWHSLVENSVQLGWQFFETAIDPDVLTGSVDAPAALGATPLPPALNHELHNFVHTPFGVAYAKHINQRRNSLRGAPILFGGGFPFNQTQFSALNARVAAFAPVDLYDLICTGLSSLYDAALRGEEGCKMYAPRDGAALVRNILAFKLAYILIEKWANLNQTNLLAVEPSLFRLIRLSYRGISLSDQAVALQMISQRQKYHKGEAILAGISYGGSVVAHTGALYPGQYKALVLFSPAFASMNHYGTLAQVDSFLTNSNFYLRKMQNDLHDLAYSFRYDAYRPLCLADNNEAYRAGLEKRMLGELDLDLTADLAQVRDPIFMVTGAKDHIVQPKLQIQAMRAVLQRNPQLGRYILIPNGGHALWGNATDAAEDAVVAVLAEVEKGIHSALQGGGVYVWNAQTAQFDLLGTGLDGLDRAETMVGK